MSIMIIKDNEFRSEIPSTRIYVMLYNIEDARFRLPTGVKRLLVYNVFKIMHFKADVNQQSC
ncbi:hypothetical protein [Paenibacillus lemnae]|uniref:Uncharacterized protein n=1 Tax=Paenibacillus lemnae TaxID=1330551 RepID=A0A848M467_PAELE|nr:hypothetical protein [Paenibacillus lemnae]NMO94892.1 hypothetical protein [Paenibacillus lemnae]